jgi:hypothetical protein
VFTQNHFEELGTREKLRIEMPLFLFYGKISNESENSSLLV